MHIYQLGIHVPLSFTEQRRLVLVSLEVFKPSSFAPAPLWIELRLFEEET